MGLQVPITLQQQYSLACREIEYEVVPAALHNEIGLLPWSPLAGGFLSGKYTRYNVLDADGTRYGDGNAMFRYIGKTFAGNERNWATIDAVREIADQIGDAQSGCAELGHQPPGRLRDHHRRTDDEAARRQSRSR